MKTTRPVVSTVVTPSPAQRDTIGSMRILLSVYLGLLTLLAAVTLAGSALLIRGMAPSSPADTAASRYSFNFVSWELRHLPEKWLYKFGNIFREEGSDDERIARYFTLVDEINNLQSSGSDPSRLKAAEAERVQLENGAEDIIEGRVTAVLRDEGLTMGPPPFTDLDIIFPPVDFEFDSPLRLLAVSPRDRIALRTDYLLKPGLDRETVERIEAEAESDGDTSALVIQSAGVATYPSMISGTRAYEDLVDTVFHEWLHQHLVFYPIGQAYFSNDRGRTLNESVANLAGHELARLYIERYGGLEAETPVAPGPTTAPGFDFTTEMRALRVQVEEMLADGDVEGAEALMNRKRDEFEASGRYVRRINQAYFAFHGFYADTPGSVDPIGPKLQAVLERAGSPGDFIRLLYGVTSEDELDALVAAGP